MADAIRLRGRGKWHRPEGRSGWDGAGMCDFTVCRLGLRPVETKRAANTAPEDRCKRCFPTPTEESR